MGIGWWHALFSLANRRACPSRAWPGYDDSNASSKPPKTAPTSRRAICPSSAPSTARSSPPPPCPARRSTSCRSPARSARSERLSVGPATPAFLSTIRYRGAIPVGYKPCRSLSYDWASPIRPPGGAALCLRWTLHYLKEETILITWC